MSSSAPARILVLGSGGREHALAWRLLVGGGRTPRDDREVFLSPGNPGAARDVPCLRAAKTPADVVRLAQDERIDLVVVGPEQPLVDGVVDALEGAGVCVLGPSQHCATLEGSKAFMKDVAAKANVPTAAYGVFTDESDAIQFLQSLAETDPRVAIKADGLCAGKGVVLTSSLDDSIRVVKSFLGSDGDDARFGDASTKVVIEQFLDGVELSVFALCDGDNAHLFATARDHKRLLDGDEGPNTGGMGAVGPLGDAHAVNDALLDRVRDEVITPVLRTLKADGHPYRGLLYAGLMIDGDDVNLLEFNVRFGDPEAEALLFATDVDLLPAFMTVARHESLGDDTGALRNCAPVACVVLASEGYPTSPLKGRSIAFTDDLDDDAKVFFAGVAAQDGELVTSGGRVLCVSARGDDLQHAIDKAYRAVDGISFTGMQVRRDIGHSLFVDENA